MASTCGYVLAIASFLTLAACGTTRRFVDQPHVTIDGSRGDPRQAAAELFAPNAPYEVSLCDADPVSRQCKRGSDGIHANGVGGLFFPLVLHVTGMAVSKERRSDDGWIIDASVRSQVDAIAPLCRTAHGRVVLGKNGTITLRLPDFYCNWVVIGNVLTNADFSVDHIDLKDRVFSGFYRVTFHGTGNAAGSGYYRAAIVPAAPPRETRM